MCIKSLENVHAHWPNNSLFLSFNKYFSASYGPHIFLSVRDTGVLKQTNFPLSSLYLDEVKDKKQINIQYQPMVKSGIEKNRLQTSNRK